MENVMTRDVRYKVRMAFRMEYQRLLSCETTFANVSNAMYKK